MKKFFAIAGVLAFAVVSMLAAGGPMVRTVGNGFFTNGLIVSSIPCKVYGIYGYNSTATNEFLMIFETNSAPANGTWCKIGPFPVGANQFYSVDLNYHGVDLDKCYVAMSTSSNTFTIAGTNFTFQAVIAQQNQ